MPPLIPIQLSAQKHQRKRVPRNSNVNKKGDKEDAVIILPNVRAQATLLSFKQAAEKSDRDGYLTEKCNVCYCRIVP